MNRRSFLGLAMMPLSAALLAQENPPRERHQPEFGDEIARYVAGDKASPPPQGAILFIGSSIFGEWKDLAAQMAPLPVFNRAFGGARTWEVLYYADKIVLPYKPQVVVYYCGSNDIGDGESAAEVAAGFGAFAARIGAALPETRIFFVSINKAPRRRSAWNEIDDANSRIRDAMKGNPRLGYIDVNPALFDAAGRPRLELYVEDSLHFSPAGYAELARMIRPVVEKAWAEERAPR